MPFGQLEVQKEILRKMLHQVADFCGVQVLTFCIMSNHFHVLVRVPDAPAVSDRELMRRYKVLYPKPTKYQEASANLIDLNPVRAGLVEDPKDYRFCGYAEAVAGEAAARQGLVAIWADHGAKRIDSALRAHRSLIFGKHGSGPGLSEMTRQQALKVLEAGGELPKAAMLRCRVRYFTDGAILGSAEFVRGFTSAWQVEHHRKHPPKVNAMVGDWGGLAVIQGLRKRVFD